jgi:hypothetical protein
MAELTGAELIAAERQRQQEEEGWTPEHDAEHTYAQLRRAAVCYANYAGHWRRPGVPDGWPWHERWWKPSTDPVRDLTKAGALIAAEIDRLAAQQGSTG